MFEWINPRVQIYARTMFFALALTNAQILTAGFEVIGDRRWVPFYPFLWIFLGIGLLDYVVGRDHSNPSPEQLQRMKDNPYFRVLPVLAFGTLFWVLYKGLRFFSDETYGWVGRLGWIASTGLVTGVVSLTVGHELIHRLSRFERVLGGIMLSAVCYGTFKVEHVRGHHVDVATPADPSSARRNESLYRFLGRAMRANPRKAWQLERARLLRARSSHPWFHNEIVGWTALSAAFALGCVALAGPLGLVFFFGQSLVAVILLEATNYVQHYGLQRTLMASGRYEPVSMRHAWSTSYFLSNTLLFQLERHAHHHVHPARPYQVLLHEPESPQLPGGYGVMLVLAAIPPLWRRIMNNRLARYEATWNVRPARSPLSPAT